MQSICRYKSLHSKDGNVKNRSQFVPLPVETKTRRVANIVAHRSTYSPCGVFVLRAHGNEGALWLSSPAWFQHTLARHFKGIYTGSKGTEIVISDEVR